MFFKRCEHKAKSNCSNIDQTLNLAFFGILLLMVIGNCYPSQLNCTKSIEEFVWRKKGWPCIYNPSFNFYLYLDSNHPTKPKVNILGSGNDYTAFMHIFGVPFIDTWYTYQEDIGFYSLYHTLYDKYYFLADTMNYEHRNLTSWQQILIATPSTWMNQKPESYHVMVISWKPMLRRWIIFKRTSFIF